MSLQQSVEKALEAGKSVHFRSYLLRDSSEEKLATIIDTILLHYGREDIAGPIFASVRELVQNASKANLKRAVFEEFGLDPHFERQYEQGMEHFRESLNETKLAYYRPLLIKKDLHFNVSFLMYPEVIVITVENPYALYGTEEARIREKFRKAQQEDNLYGYFMNHVDTSEGAGMGIAMITIMLDRAAVPRHNFTLFCDAVLDQTYARIIVPIAANYISPREQFDLILRQASPKDGLNADILRAKVQSGEVILSIRGHSPFA